MQSEKVQTETGLIVRWNAERGFGFIERIGEPDVFLHITQVHQSEQELIARGRTVRFGVVPARDGRLRAIHVEVVAE